MGLGMKVVVGLGNPGEKYADTRHNVGFWVVDRLAKKLGVAWKHEQDAFTAAGQWSDVRVLLVKPQTYMNRSGEAVGRIQEAYGLAPEAFFIVYDDLALAPGTLRVRAKGSSGGHNGIKSIIHYLGTESFPRLRVGIGSVPDGVPSVEYVLAPPTQVEFSLIDQAVDAGVDASLSWIEDGIERTMSRFNGVWSKPPEHP